MNRADIHAGGRQARLQVIGEEILADAAGHARQHGTSANASRRTGLIRTLASRQHLEFASERGFAGHRKVLHADDKVHVETSSHEQNRLCALHRARSMPSFFSSSA